MSQNTEDRALKLDQAAAELSAAYNITHAQALAIVTDTADLVDAGKLAPKYAPNGEYDHVNDLAERCGALVASQNEQLQKFIEAHTVYVSLRPGDIVRTIDRNTVSVMDANRVERWQIEKPTHSEFEFTVFEEPSDESRAEARALLRRLTTGATDDGDACGFCGAPKSVPCACADFERYGPVDEI